MKSGKWILGVATAVGMAGATLGCADQPFAGNAQAVAAQVAERQEAIDEEALAAAVGGNNGFAAELYRHVAREAEGKNLIMSPFSVSSALAMTWEGARGETADQMRAVLQVPSGDDGPWASALMHRSMGDVLHRLNQQREFYELVIANGLWVDESMPLRDGFLDAIQPNYTAQLATVDYRGNPEGSRQQINDWVSRVTVDRINDLLPQGTISTDTRLVLTNAIYFKAKWANPFQKQLTRDRDFHLADGSTVQVPTMYQERRMRARVLEDGTRIVSLGYQRGAMSMLIVVPAEADGLAALEADLSADKWAEWADLPIQMVQLYLPRFHVESSFTLSDTLEAMGMPLAFNPHRADFTGMTDSAEGADLFISNVLHKAFIEVDEDGTEAAAATAVVMDLASAPMDPVVVRVDRPFLFAIRDRDTGTVLFTGRVMNPR